MDNEEYNKIRNLRNERLALQDGNCQFCKIKKGLLLLEVIPEIQNDDKKIGIDDVILAHFDCLKQNKFYDTRT